MSVPDKLKAAIISQFDMFISAQYHNNTSMFICWAAARSLCISDLDSTDLVDMVFKELCVRYTTVSTKLSKVNENLYHLEQRNPKYLDPDPLIEYYLEESKLLDEKCICVTILKHLEPSVSSAFNDQESVYYALTYME